jgi:dihydroxy-acid dehydratase
VIKAPEIIRPMDDPVRPNGGLAVLRGNLSPDGAIVKKSAVPERMFRYRGPARVFECEEDAIYQMFNGKVTPGECVIIRYEGPKGGPGMREMAIPAHLLQLLGLGDSSALVTDGRYSGTNYGMCIGHVSPEAADGGPLAVVQDGDTIEVDIHERRIRLDIPDDELEKRLSAWQPPEPRFKKGILSWYARNVTSGDKGAVLRPGGR